MRRSDGGRRVDDWDAYQAEISSGRQPASDGDNRSVFAAAGLPDTVSLPGCRPGRLLVGIIAGFFANTIRKDVERPFTPALIEGGRGPWLSVFLHVSGSKEGGGAGWN